MGSRARRASATTSARTLGAWLSRLLEQFARFTLDHIPRLAAFGHAPLDIVVDVAALALARHVLHDRDHADDLAIDIRRGQRRGLLVGDLAAQMHEVLGAQHAVGAGEFQCVDHGGEDFAALGILDRGTDAERVEDGGDAAADDLGVVGEHRTHHVPAHMGAREDVLLQMIGMDVDQPGQQQVALKIDGAGYLRSAHIDAGDEPVAEMHGAVDDRVVENDPGAGQD